MNDDDRPTDWPDDRLAAAFRARADAHPTPSDLLVATMDRVRRVPRVAPTRDRFVRLGGLVAAAAVLAIVAVALVSGPTAGPIGSAGPTTLGSGGLTTFGLPVLSVAEAIAIRDGTADDREIAVHGFVSGRLLASCPFDPRPPNPTDLRCPEGSTWLMSEPESVVTRTSNSVTMHGPAGPALNPGLALVDTTGVVSDSDVANPVLFIGHFDDRRADSCPVDIRPTCADTFIVDRIDRGTMQTVTFNDQAAAGQTDSEIDALINRVDPTLRILSRRVVAIDRLAAIEPVYQQTPGGAPSYVSGAAWLVTALPPVDGDGRAVARTFVIFDGTDSISEMTRNGPVDVALGEPASPMPDSVEPFNVSSILAAPITVSQAIDHRDSHLDGTELAVAGYWIDHSGWLRCAATLQRSPVELGCQWRWLTELPPIDRSNTSGPDQPALAPILDVGAFVDPAIADRVTTGVSAIALGHFDDPRAAECDPNRVELCRGNFIVDAILDPARQWPAGTASTPGITCASLTIADCVGAAAVALASVNADQVVPKSIEVGDGIWCPTPGRLFANASCPGGIMPADGGQWVGHARVTFESTTAQAYINIAKSGTVVRAKTVALATPPPLPN
jgi:hypothetical protein